MRVVTIAAGMERWRRVARRAHHTMRRSGREVMKLCGEEAALNAKQKGKR